jgi:hypothetical protein
MNAALEAAEGKFSPRPNENYRPYKALAEVLRIFGETKDSWGLAFWFEDSMVSWMMSVRRIFSLPILSKSSPRPRSRAFRMARRVADYRPPAGPLNVTLITWDRGREMHRVHDSAYLGNQFNPTSSGNARFSPIRDSSGAIIPTRSMPAQLSTALSWKLSFMICLTRPARFALRGRVATRT